MVGLQQVWKEARDSPGTSEREPRRRAQRQKAPWGPPGVGPSHERKAPGMLHRTEVHRAVSSELLTLHNPVRLLPGSDMSYYLKYKQRKVKP